MYTPLYTINHLIIIPNILQIAYKKKTVMVSISVIVPPNIFSLRVIELNNVELTVMNS